MSIVQDAKDITDLIRKLDNVELYQKILDLRGEIIEMTEENHSLQKKIKDFEGLVNITKNMKFKAPFWFIEGDPIPYCPRCWESNKIVIHLVGPFGDSEKYDCPDSRTSYLNGPYGRSIIPPK